MEAFSISKLKNYIIWCIFIFIFIYAPPVLPYTHLIEGILVLLAMGISYNHYYREAFVDSDIKLWLKVMIGVLAYAIFIPLPLSAFYNDIVDLPHYYHLFNRFAILVFMEVTCGTFLLARFKRKGYTFLFLLKVIIGAALVQSALACLAFISPSVKEIFLSFMIKMGGLSTENEGVIIARTFGFAGSMLDQFGYGTGLLAGIAFYLGISYKSRYILYSLLIIIASALNARSGLVIYAMAVFITIAFSIFINRNLKMIVKSLAFIIILPTVLVASLNIVAQYNETTALWLSKGFESVVEFGTTGSSDMDNMRVITSERFWQMPDAAHILIGTGHSRYLAEGYLHTDCGIVNDIWFVGIIGLVMLYGIVVYLCYKIFKDSHTSLEKFLSVFLITSFFVFDIKAASIGYNMGGAVFFLILFATRFYQRISIDKEGLKII